jgi:hypothetical protein
MHFGNGSKVLAPMIDIPTNQWGKHPIVPVRFYVHYETTKTWLPSANWKVNQYAIVVDGLEPRLNGKQPLENTGDREHMLHPSKYGDL